MVPEKQPELTNTTVNHEDSANYNVDMKVFQNRMNM